METKGIYSLWRKVWGNMLYRFLISFLFLYLCFYYFNLLYIGLTAPGGFYVPFLDQHLDYVQGLRKVLIQTSATIIRQFDYELYTTPVRLHVDRHGGIILIYSCLGFSIMSAFAAFVITWPGKSRKSKFFFLTGGLILIQILNIIRLIGLCLLGKQFPLKKEIDHHTLFNIVVYLILILIVYLWIRNPKKVPLHESSN